METANSLRAIKDALADPKTKREEEAKKNFFDGFQAHITKSTLSKLDTTGDEIFSRFKNDINRIVQKRRDAGQDVMELFDAFDGNKSYLGRTGFIKHYLRGTTEIMEGVVRQFRGGNFKPQTMSPEQFLDQ
jgi:hypothetical protein